MSEQEQFAAIGRMVKERTEARRQLALLDREIRDKRQVFETISTQLAPAQLSGANLDKAASAITAFQNAGGLERLKVAIEEFKALTIRQQELSVSLRAADVE